MATPNDPLFAQQWHFALIGDIQTIWDEFTGSGVRAVVYDDGTQYTHPDLAANYDATLEFTFNGIHYDPLPIGNRAHGTACAGLIGAVANDAIGGVGVAWGVTLSAVDYLGEIYGKAQNIYAAAMNHAANFDIMSNSWGYSSPFEGYRNLNVAGSQAVTDEALYANVAATGRGGLGTVILQAAGNDTSNANGDALNTTRHTLTIAATDQNGIAATYSNYGTCILITAPAAAVTTDIVGTAGFNNGSGGFNADYLNNFSGTSAATPVVAGVVALMLEANAALGWRDVANILALSAAHTGSAFGQAGTGAEVGAWNSVGGTGWNGGGTTWHQSYGYGMVDAFAAVRMAEAWTEMNGAARTSANEMAVTFDYAGAAVTVPDRTTVALTAAVTQDIEVETVYVTLTLTCQSAWDPVITLVTPDGKALQVYSGDQSFQEGVAIGSFASAVSWTFAVESLRGYSSAGTWTVNVQDKYSSNTTRVDDFKLTFFGAAASVNDVHHFTDDFQALAAVETSRQVISDTNGGIDWLNFSALAGDLSVNMAAGGQIAVGGVRWADLSSAATQFENLYAGDGDDLLTGNNLKNRVLGGRGNDLISSAGGNDRLDGGAGSDQLLGGKGQDLLIGGAGADRLVGGAGNDVLRGGAGKDVFEFALGDGQDTVFGFGDDIDTLKLDDAIWGGGLSVAQVISTFGIDLGASVQLNFVTQAITINGIADLAALQNDISIF